MSLFSTATATTTGSSGSMNFMSFLPMIVIFILFWFLLIRPQQKKAKEHNRMIAELQKDDEVVTNSGILGKIVKINDNFILLEVANNTVITVQRSTVGGKVEKGTINKNSK